MDITTATPPEIDRVLADLYRDEMRAEQQVAAAAVRLHRALGERLQRFGRTEAWPTSDADALAACRARGDERLPLMYGRGTYADEAAQYDRAVADLAAVKAAQKPLDAEFNRRGGWSRFFVVQQHNGHIHESMSCSTCNRGKYRTQFGWNPDLSGLSEAEAVAKLGPMLCSVCFPSAPVEWIAGRTDDRCTAGIIEGSIRKGARSTWADCRCGAIGILVNGDGRLRKHKPVKSADEIAADDAAAERAQRADQAAAEVAEMHPEDVAGRTAVVAAHLDQAAAAADAAAADEPAAPALTGDTAGLLAVLDDALRAAGFMAPADVERPTGRVRNPDKFVTLPPALTEPRFGALHPALVDALARREPIDGPVYGLVVHVRIALVGPFASPVEARAWWDVEYNRLAGRARFVIVPAAALTPAPGCPVSGGLRARCTYGYGHPGPCSWVLSVEQAHAEALQMDAGEVAPDGAAGWTAYHRNHPEVLANWAQRNGRQPNCPCAKCDPKGVRTPAPPAGVVRTGGLVVDERAGTARPALAPADPPGAVLTGDVLAVDQTGPAGWRHPVTLTEAAATFPPGRRVRHRNPKHADWRGTVEPMPRAGRHIEDHGSGPVVRIRWDDEPDDTPAQFYAASCIEADEDA